MKHVAKLSEYQAAALRYCFAATPSATLLDTLGGDRRGWDIYREMSRKRLARMIRAGLPRTFSAIADEQGDSVGHDMIARFFEERAVRSDFMRDCVPEFVDWLSSTPEPVPKRVTSLAALERTRWQVRDHLAGALEFSEFDFERPPIVNPTAVHLTLACAPDAKAPAGPDVLFFVTVYRDSSNVVREMQMTQFARALVGGWSEASLPAIASAKAAAEELNIAIDDTFVKRMCTALERFLEDELVLGSH